MKKILLLLILISLHIFILSRFIFTAWPEMLSYPFLFSKGFSLYKDFIFPYPPGLIFILNAVFQIFGFTPEILRFFTWGMIIIGDLVMYLIFEKIIKNRFYIFLFLGLYIILQSSLDGNMLWFDFATVIPLLLAFLFSLFWIEKKSHYKIFFISLFLALAIFIKQTAILYVLFFAVFYFLERKKIVMKEFLLFSGGFLTVFFPWLIYLLANNLLPSFWLWVFYYPLTEWSKFPGYVNFTISKREFFVNILLIIPLVFGLIYLKRKIISPIFFTLIFLIAAIIAVYPRFSYFHLQPALAFLVIILAQIFNVLKGKQQVIFLTVTVFCLLMVMFLTVKNNLGSDIRFYGKPEQLTTRDINEWTQIDDKVFLLGVYSSQYVFTDKLPPKNWSDNFGWYLEIPGVSEWVLEGFTKDPPKIFFYTEPLPGQWFDLGTYQPQKIVDYMKRYYTKTITLPSGVQVWIRKS